MKIFHSYFWNHLQIPYLVVLLNIGTPKMTTIILLTWSNLVHNEIMHPNDADGMRNSVDTNQTAP